MAPAGSSIYAALPAELRASHEKKVHDCTTDGEDKPAEATLHKLFDALRAASPDECAAFAECFDQRLAHSSVDVKVKAILLMNDCVKLGLAPLHAALLESCAATLGKLKDFTAKPHPVHGELPAKMVRLRSERLLATLQLPPPSQAGGGGSGGLGCFGLTLALLVVLLALLAAGLHQNHGSANMLWYRTKIKATTLFQSASDTLGIAPPPSATETPWDLDSDGRKEPIAEDEIYAPGKDTPPPPPPPPPPTHVNRSLAVALERLAISRRALPCAARARCSWRARADRLTKRRVVDLHRLEHVGAPPVACVSEGERVDHHETATGELLTRGGVGGDQPSELRAAGLRPGGRVRLLGRVLNQRVHEARGHSVVLERLIGCGTGSGTTGQRACQLVLQVPTQRRWYVKCSSGLCEE